MTSEIVIIWIVRDGQRNSWDLLQTPGSDYKVDIEIASNININDLSNSPFIITL
jgi:hypothetical protein